MWAIWVNRAGVSRLPEDFEGKPVGNLEVVLMSAIAALR
jgi:hypothetical protein